MADERDPCERINAILCLQAVVTYRGDEVKCWTPTDYEGGGGKTYLSADECAELAKAFAELATMLRKAPTPGGGDGA